MKDAAFAKKVDPGKIHRLLMLEQVLQFSLCARLGFLLFYRFYKKTRGSLLNLNLVYMRAFSFSIMDNSSHLRAVLFVLLSLCLQGSVYSASQLELPWLTGPLLAPTPYTLGVGHVNYQPYVYWVEKDREYNSDWESHPVRHLDTLGLQPLTKFGVFPRGELDVVPRLFYKNSEGANSWRLGDLSALLSYQLVEEDKLMNWTWPDVKLRLNVVFPLGHYDRLNPQKYLTDIGGNGSWDPGFSLIMGKFLHITDIHWLVTRFAFAYAFGTPVSVHGISTYGGSKSTRGTVYPGNLWVLNLGWEFTLARRWALACDLEVDHHDASHFSGKRGELAPHRPSSNLLIVAPAIEYNYSAKTGIIFGPSITFAGRNAQDSIAWILSMNLRR